MRTTPRSVLLPGLALALAGSLALTATQGTASAAGQRDAAVPSPAQKAGAKQATASGYGGAVTTVDPDGHADRPARCCAAAATRSTPRSRPRRRSASPSPTAPASAVAATSSTTTRETGQVHTIDGRETAPAAMSATRSSTRRPASRTRSPSWSPAASPSACPVRRRPGTRRCAVGHARRWPGAAPGGRGRPRGFVVDETFRQQTADNAARFAPFTLDAATSTCPAASRRRSASVPQPGPRPHLRVIARRGTDAFYGGELAARSCATVQHPPMTGSHRPAVRPGHDDAARPRGYDGAARRRRPRSATAATTSTAWRRRRAAARRSVRR